MTDAATGDVKTYLVGGQAYDALRGMHGYHYFRENAVLRFLVNNNRLNGNLDGLRIDTTEVYEACDKGLIPLRDWVEFMMGLGYRPGGIQELLGNTRWEVSELGDGARPAPLWNPSDGVDPQWVDVDGIPLLTLDDHGVRRFVPNAVVRYTVLRRDTNRIDLDKLAHAFARGAFPAADYAWFHAMLGYPVETVRTMPAFAGLAFSMQVTGEPTDDPGPYRARAVDVDLNDYADLHMVTKADPQARHGYMLAVNDGLMTWDAPKYATALPYMLLRFGPPNYPGEVGRAPFGRWLVTTPDLDVVVLVTPGAPDVEAMFRPYAHRKDSPRDIPATDPFRAFGDALSDLRDTGVRLNANVVLTLFGEEVGGSAGTHEPDVVPIHRGAMTAVPAGVTGMDEHARLWDVASTIGSGNAAEGLRAILGIVDRDART